MLPDITSIILAFGLIGIVFTIFAESGMFFGFFLPGDSLLVTAGLLASRGFFNIEVLLIVLPIAAILGDSVGYWFGSYLGKRIYVISFVKKEYIKKTEKFYKIHGAKTIVLARYIPIVRTFAPIVAGVAKMDYQTFIVFNILGGLLWTTSMLMLGFIVGETVPNIDKYLVPIVVIVIAISLMLAYWEKRRL